MKRNFLKKGDIVELTIDRTAQGGRGVGRIEGFVVFVPLTATDDRIRARITRVHKRHADAEIVEILEESPDRTEAPCPYYGQCGGCAWQHISYPAQLRTKEAVVRESFERLSKNTENIVLTPVSGSEEQFRYRNKMEFSFHPDAILGMHRRGYFDRILEIDDCMLASEGAVRIMQTVKAFVRDYGLSCRNAKNHTGFFRHLIIREGNNEIMVVPVTGTGIFPHKDEFIKRLLDAEPRISGIVRARTDSRADASLLDDLEPLYGKGFIREELGGIFFRIEPDTFFQTNTAQAKKMFSMVMEMAELKGNEKVIDLFCGVGTFSLLMAKKASKVYGLEVVERAVNSARENARREKLDNIEFMVSDARRGLPKLLEKIDGPPDLLVLDPPRSGAGGRVMRRIGRSAPRRVIYVSCNPSTLAPDLDWLVPFGYEINRIKTIDLFPQTYHVETIVRLDRKPEADLLPDPFRT